MRGTAAPPTFPRPHRRNPRYGRPARLLLASLSCLLFSCSLLPQRAEEPLAPVLHPQASVTTGPVWLQPRHAPEPRPLAAPLLLEPDDAVETGPTGKAELRLPPAAVRLYGHSRVRFPFAFEGRSPVCREVILEHGEVLVRTTDGAPFTVRTPALRVELSPGSTVLVALRGDVHRIRCHAGLAEARNVKIRGQTLVRMGAGQQLTLDRGATVVTLEDADLPDGWSRWSDPEVLTAGAVPPPAPPAQPADSQ